MPNARSHISPIELLGRSPTSADDIVVMITDVLYEYLQPDSDVGPEEAVDRVLEILESAIAVEIYDREMARRQPRAVDTWH